MFCTCHSKYQLDLASPSSPRPGWPPLGNLNVRASSAHGFEWIIVGCWKESALGVKYADERCPKLL